MTTRKTLYRSERHFGLDVEYPPQVDPVGWDTPAPQRPRRPPTDEVFSEGEAQAILWLLRAALVTIVLSGAAILLGGLGGCGGSDYPPLQEDLVKTTQPVNCQATPEVCK